MRVTIIYDNETSREDLRADWGFSCLVEAQGKRILFDTGAKGAILLGNMKKLDIDPSSIGGVFISHADWDHTGGFLIFLRKTVPPSSISLHRTVRRPTRPGRSSWYRGP